MHYTFELLEPLMGPYRSITCLLARPNTEESLFQCFCFATQCLFALENLHTFMDFVHSDISPNNIMYNGTSETWKLIDFNHSCSIAESLVHSRVAGTDGYVAPESKLTGIFTEKSDIYSLGKVFTEVIDSIFLNQIYSVESDDEDDETIAEIRSLEVVAMKFSNLIDTMIQFDPSARPTARAALKTVYSLFQSTFEIPKQLIFISINSRLKIYEREQEQKLGLSQEKQGQQKQKGEQEDIPEKAVIIPIPVLSPSKRTRIAEEEKESFTSFAPQIQ